MIELLFCLAAAADTDRDTVSYVPATEHGGDFSDCRTRYLSGGGVGQKQSFKSIKSLYSPGTGIKIVTAGCDS